MMYKFRFIGPGEGTSQPTGSWLGVFMLLQTSFMMISSIVRGVLCCLDYGVAERSLHQREAGQQTRWPRYQNFQGMATRG